MSDTTGELALKLAIDADDTADYLTIDLRNSLNVLDGVFSSSTGHNHNGAHQGGNLVFGVLNTTSIAFANGATLGPFSTGNQLRFQSTNVSFSGAIAVDGAATITGALTANGPLSTSLDLTVGRDLHVVRNTGLDGTVTVTGTTTLGAVNINGVLSTGAINSGGAINAASFAGSDFTASTGWHHNGTAARGLLNDALGVGLRFDSGRAGPIMHGGAYDGARVHGTPHVRVGYFTTPSVGANSETTVSVTFSPAFPAGASPVAMLTLLRNVSDNMLWRIGLEFGQTTTTGLVARVRNDNATIQGVSVAFLAYWNE